MRALAGCARAAGLSLFQFLASQSLLRVGRLYNKKLVI